MPVKRSAGGLAVSQAELDMFSDRPYQMPIENQFYEPHRSVNLNPTDYR